MSKQTFKLTARNLKLGDAHAELPALQGYLMRFGYISRSASVAATFDDKTEAAIKLFQQRHALPVTGTIDDATVKVMEMPRCGVPDIIPAGRADTGAPYVLRGCSYQGHHRVLTYAFTNATPDLPGDAERAPIRAALASWAQITNIDFVEVSPAQNPIVTFGWHTGNHGDGSSFDGPGRILAHAFYPPPCGGAHAGKCHFDEDETWALSQNQGFDLQTVSLHELGHIIGLDHSTVAGSVMFPTYSGERRVLKPDDIAGAQALHGKRGLQLRLRVHLQDIGDVVVRDNEFGGTRGQSRRLEGFQLEIATAIPGLSCRYMAHLQDIGDVPWGNEGQFVGTRGQSRRLEGFAIELTGAAAANYNVFYMAHLQDIGDTPMHSNGQFCGTRGQSRRLEGMLVRIEPK
jgi:peptidoglycan hydrolase-like protein with peptidoglycan-binding domain